MHPYFHLFGLNIPAYGTMAGIGFLAAGLYAVLLSRGDRRVSRADLGYAAVIAGCGMLIGAKLLALVTEIPFIIEFREQIFSSLESFSLFFLSGWVFYGGLIGGLVGAWMFCRRWKVDFGAVCDIAAPAIPLFHAFGRVGRFLSGCCHGIRWEHGIAFTEAIAAPNGVPLFPVQLVEAGCNLLLCVALTLMRKKCGRSGTLMCVYLASYAVIRFALEFLRGDRIRGVFILSTSQWISIAIAVFVAIWFIKRPKFQAKETE